MRKYSLAEPQLCCQRLFYWLQTEVPCDVCVHCRARSKGSTPGAAGGAAPLGDCECAPCACELACPQLLPVLVSLRGHLARRASVFQGPALSHEALLGSQVTGSSFPCRAGPTGLSPFRGVLSDQLPRTRWDAGPPCAAWSRLRGPGGVLAPQPEAKEVSQLAQARVGGQQQIWSLKQIPGAECNHFYNLVCVCVSLHTPVEVCVIHLCRLRIYRTYVCVSVDVCVYVPHTCVYVCMCMFIVYVRVSCIHHVNVCAYLCEGHMYVHMPVVFPVFCIPVWCVCTMCVYVCNVPVYIWECMCVYVMYVCVSMCLCMCV